MKTYLLFAALLVLCFSIGLTSCGDKADDYIACQIQVHDTSFTLDEKAETQITFTVTPANTKFKQVSIGCTPVKEATTQPGLTQVSPMVKQIQETAAQGTYVATIGLLTDSDQWLVPNLDYEYDLSYVKCALVIQDSRSNLFELNFFIDGLTTQ